MRFFLFVILCLLDISTWAQLTDNFEDGNFSSNPQWVGSSSDFNINASGQLQTNSSVASTSYLTVNNNLTNLNSKEWRFWIKLNFSPSASNFSKVYLVSSNTDLTIDPDGFYVQFGETGSLDAVRLFKRQGGVSTEICAGLAGQIANSFAIGVRVVRDNTGNWNLYVDPSGGENFSSPSTGFDNSIITGTSTGIICTYTVSNANKFYFDNFYVGDEIVDIDPPVLLSTTAVYANQVDVLFSEPVDANSAQLISNYAALPFIDIANVTIDNINPALAHLSLNTSLVNGTTYLLSTSSIADISNNISGIQSVSFTYLVNETTQYGDVIISEFMSDPSPSIGLPEVEFIEIFNKSNKYFNLQNWTIGDASGHGTIQDRWLSPGEYLILCSTASLTDYINGVGVTSFPSLNNSGDEIHLKDDTGRLLDELTYTDAWYLDDQKKNGGYTLERIKLVIPCSGPSNWKASNALLGGTPGLVNSVNDTTLDLEKPIISSIDVVSQNSIQINFNEGMDSSSLALSNITITPSISVGIRVISTVFPLEMQLDFSENMIGSQVYNITLDEVSDCSLNTTEVSSSFALPETPILGDVIINEILFNPLTGGSDFIEIYNNSNKLIDLFDWQLANSDNDSLANFSLISSHYLLKQSDFVAITKDTLFLKQHYPYTVARNLIQSNLPNYNNDSSTVYLVYSNEVMDRVSYTEEWQFKLLDDPKGKSLERINSKGSSNVSSNWHTAAESVDFATPGRQNSQDYKNNSTGNFEFNSQTVSPDNDGFEDVLQVHYTMQSPGMIGAFTIYDDKGRVIKNVFKNELLASEGTFSWDGISDNLTRAIIGTYVGVFEAFDSETGEKFNKTKAFVVAGKL